MKISNEHKIFLKKMNIEYSRIEKLELDTQILVDIADDFTKSQEDFFDSAEHIAKKIQRCKQVHSVRWRVKDVSHLIEKIIRKKEAKAEKYLDINSFNYKSKIDDLIGVRAIYLFKHDWLPVHQHILSKWTPSEPVTIYHREGDDLEQYLAQPECETKQHNDSYRSIHYIISAGQIHSEEISCEVQTRTIFEEAWSEIDHKVRYPSFSEDPHLKQFLNIFNRLAGSADEMGSYVIALTQIVNAQKIQLEESILHQNKINELEVKISDLIGNAKENKELQKAYQQLKNEKEAEKAKRQLMNDFYSKNPLSSLNTSIYNTKDINKIRESARKVTEDYPEFIAELYSKNFK